MNEPAHSRLRAVRARIEDACASCGRDPAEVTLLAVSKGHGADAVKAFYELGVCDFGESYVQEWQRKVDECPADIRWHFIGHLQSNKVKYLANRVHLVHSVDRPSLLRELARRWESPCPILLQINVGDDPAKFGPSADQALELLNAAEAEPNVELRGLMTMPPLAAEPEEARPHFRALAELGRRWRAKSPNTPLSVLSMGMTDDLEVAIEEGSTIVRVGTALFGPRSYE